jgi:hypothetical protein
MKYKVQHFQLILIPLTIIAPLKYQPVHFSSCFSLPKISYYTKATISTSPSTLENLGLRPPKQLSPEEEKAEALWLKKIARAKEQKKRTKSS